MMKMDGILSGVTLKPDLIGSLFRIVKNTGGNLQTGHVFTLTMPKVIEGKVTLHINGQSITLENFPKSLQDKPVTMQVVKSGKKSAVEIISIGKESHQKKGDVLQKANFLSTPQPNKQSSLITSIQKKNVVTIKPEPATVIGNPQVSKKKMPSNVIGAPRTALLTSSIISLPDQQKKINVIVTQASVNKATLKIVPNINLSNLKPHITASKTAQAVAQTDQPEKIITQTQSVNMELKIEHLSSPLKKGEYLSLEVITTTQKHSPKKQTAIILKQIEAITGQQNTPSITTKKLAQHQQFSAKVEQRLPSGNITFNWQGQSFEAEAPQHVQVGDVLNLKVEKAGRKARLAVLDIVKKLPEKATALFRHSIARSEPMAKVLQTLMQLNAPNPTAPLPANTELAALTTLLESYSISSDKPLDGPRFISMIRDSGLLHEAMLGRYLHNPTALIKHVQQLNLKTALLHIAEAAQAANPSQKSSAISQAAEQGVGRIEAQQALNLLSLQQIEPLRLEIPMIIQGQVASVQMAITAQPGNHQENNDNETNSDGFNILFSLDLSSLGNIRIDARITSQSVHAGFYSESSDTRLFIQQHISRLTDRLEASGFKNIQLSTASEKQLAAEKTEQFSRLETGLPISRGLLDVTG